MPGKSLCHRGNFPVLFSFWMDMTRLLFWEAVSHCLFARNSVLKGLFNPGTPVEAAIRAAQNPKMMNNDFIMPAPIPYIPIDAVMTKKVARLDAVD